MKIAIVGYGSIGKKHSSLLESLDCEVYVVSKRSHVNKNFYLNLKNCLKEKKPSIIWICNKTSEHLSSIQELSKLNYSGTVLIEKPIFSHSKKIPSNNFENIFVSYNLRFHPILRELQKILQQEVSISANIYVGQYLPTWRSKRDYRESYSSNKVEGGGVIRDLSHEIDYAMWLFGTPTKISSIGGKFSNLEIDSDDVFSLLYASERCPVVNITMNYLDRIIQRFLIINTLTNTYKADLINGTLEKNSELLLKTDISKIYEEQALSLLNNNFTQWCTIKEALTVLKVVESAERSNEEKRWISL